MPDTEIALEIRLHIERFFASPNQNCVRMSGEAFRYRGKRKRFEYRCFPSAVLPGEDIDFRCDIINERIRMISDIANAK
jgi:hypothetical protein